MMKKKYLFTFIIAFCFIFFCGRIVFISHKLSERKELNLEKNNFKLLEESERMVNTLTEEEPYKLKTKPYIVDNELTAIPLE